MKKYSWYWVLGLTLVTKSALAATLTITIDNVQQNKGKLYIGLFTEKDKFPVISDDLNMLILQVKEKTVTARFENLEMSKKYAVAVFQDINDSAVLEKNMFGIPKEPYGFSQKMPRLRAAKFHEAAIMLMEPEMDIQIRLR